jgi:uncharacterized protein
MIISLSWTSQVSSASKEELNNDLIRAAHRGQTEKVLALIKMGADVNAKANDNKTALMWAARNGHTEIVDLLKSAGAKGNP